MSLAVLDHEQNQKPRLRKTEFRPAHTEPATDSLSQSSRATSRSTLTRDQSESSISGKKKHKNRKSGRGHAIAVLLQVFAPNAPQAARWAASECDCLGECSCEVSPTETFAAEMVVPTEPDDYASSTTLKHSDVQRPPPKAGFARPLHHSIRNTTLSTGQDARQNGESTKPPNSTLPSCDRPSGRPWYERKRSSQQDLPTLDTFQSPKRPRTTESNLRSTLQNLGTDDSPRVIITAPKLQQHMINEPRDHNGERLKLPPLAMSSPSSTTSNTSPLARPVLPSLDSATSHPGSMSSARSRTLSTSSITTATTATSDLTPFHHPNSRTRSSSFADPSAITPASSSLLSSPSYFPPGAVHGRRTLAPAQPPPTLHKHTSSMTGTASAGSAPSLTHNESSISTPDAVTPNRTDAPSTSAPRLISIAKKPSDEDDASMSSHIPYQQVAAGYQCLYEGCDTVPFPTMYTFSYVAPHFYPRSPALSHR